MSGGRNSSQGRPGIFTSFGSSIPRFNDVDVRLAERREDTPRAVPRETLSNRQKRCCASLHRVRFLVIVDVIVVSSSSVRSAYTRHFRL